MTLGPTSYIMNINTIYISKLIIYTDIFIFYVLYYSIITFSPTELSFWKITSYYLLSLIHI